MKSSSDSATWLRKLKKQVQRITFERAKEAGEQHQDKAEGAPALHRLAPPCAALRRLAPPCTALHHLG
eukprot:761859-Prymnesium_polylepis.1